MSIKSRLRTHKEDIVMFLSLGESCAFIAGPALLYIAALDQPLTWKIWVAVVSSVFGAYRMWTKKNPIARALGVVNTSQDLPHVERSDR